MNGGGSVHFLIIIFILQLIFASSCNSQTNKNKTMKNTSLINRKPVVAGQFYPGKADEINKELSKLFTEAGPAKTDGEVLAIVSPHAGYIFSGQTAACSFNQINPTKKYKTIFVIGSSHRVSFDGASIYNSGNFETPLGVVSVDFEVANKLLNDFHVFNSRVDAHEYEHSLEVQLPFLQYVMKTGYKIVPIVIGTRNKNTCARIATALKPYFNNENLFIISTDFSHYPSYENAKIVDNETAKAILTNKPGELSATLLKNEEKNIPSLATSLCGWTSVLTLMEITKDMPDIRYELINYTNSGDALNYGEKSRVVGYWAISVIYEKNKTKKTVTESDEEFNLTDEDKKKLLLISRKTLDEYVKTNKIPQVSNSEISENLNTNCGAFVSLHIDGELRGCIGNFNTDLNLFKVVQEMTVSSASRDCRFFPVKEQELTQIDIEISVLTPMKKIDSIDEIVLGKHGIYIKKDNRSGTFLPQVATHTKWTLEEFLGHCAKDKAGIGWNGWHEAEIYTYEAIVFSEKELMR